MHYNCLIVDDEADLAKMTCEYFELFDVSCACVADAAACKEFLGIHEVDVLLLDINLSEESGFAILVALNIGGDDYIKKPYTLSILLAKVKAVLKRLPGKSGKGSEACRLYLDESIFCAFLDGRKVELKAKEFKLLQCLFENRNTIVTKEKLFEKVWGDAFFGDGTLNVHIRRLREKLEKDPDSPRLIKTVWGTGYLLEI